MTDCPVCGSASRPGRILTAAFLARRLAEYFGTSAAPPDLVRTSYEVHTCLGCSLVFFDPMVEGDGAFYSWLTKQEGYYPVRRWDWDQVVPRLHRTSASTLLEVGCGSGAFLRHLGAASAIRAVGLDTDDAAVVAARQSGAEVLQGTIEEFLQQRPSARASFDAVVSFHCLEHVSDPVSFLRSMATAVRPNGVIYVSTPLTPMSFEARWHDPLNHPPHHLTRWSPRALAALGARVSRKVDLSYSPQSSLAGRLINGVCVAALGLEGLRAPLGTRLGRALASPKAVAAELAFQVSRGIQYGFGAGDIVLAAFHA